MDRVIPLKIKACVRCPHFNHLPKEPQAGTAECRLTGHRLDRVFSLDKIPNDCPLEIIVEDNNATD